MGNIKSAPPSLIAGALAVDAACSGNPGAMEYRGVQAWDGKEIFRKGPFQQGTNNIGEFLALVHALAYFHKLGQAYGKVPIYTDSITAIAWVRKKKANTKLEITDQNREWIHLVDRAEQWLAMHSYANPIRKWDTVKWGEIPADFGRKK